MISRTGDVNRLIQNNEKVQGLAWKDFKWDLKKYEFNFNTNNIFDNYKGLRAKI